MDGVMENSEETTNIVASDNGESTFSQDGGTYLTTRKRWVVLIIILVILSLQKFSTMFFAYVHDMASSYFDISPELTDFLSTVNLVARGLASLLYVAVAEQLNLRYMAVGSAEAISAGSSLLVAGVATPRNFRIVLLGQVFSGFASSTDACLELLTGSNWFPKGQRRIALWSAQLTGRLAEVISNNVATRSLNVSQFEKNITAIPHTNSPSREELKYIFGTTYVKVYLLLTLVAVIALVCADFLITDYPKQVGGGVNLSAKKRAWEPIKGLKTTIRLFKDKGFLFLLLHLSLLLSIRPLIDSLLSSLLRSSFPHDTDVKAGSLFSVGLTLGGFGSIIAVMFFNRFKRPTLMHALGVIGAIIGCTLFSVALYKKNYGLLFVGYIMIATFRDVTLLSVVVARSELAAHRKLCIRIRIYILTSLPQIFSSFYTFVIRKTMGTFGAAIAVLVPIPFIALSGILWGLLYHYIWS